MKTNFLTRGLIPLGLVLSVIMVYGQFQGGPYLGQPIPGNTPEVFAPGLLPEFISVITFSPDGKGCFSSRWSVGFSSILMSTKDEGGNWPEFDTVFFSIEMDQCPHLTPDGSRLYFASYQPVPPSPFYDRHLWYSDKAGTGWSDPVMMDSPIKEHFVIKASAAGNGNLYLAIADNNDPGIFISRFVNGNYLEPEKLTDSINYLNRPLNPHIAGDESYLVFDVGETPDPLSQRDLAISYRKPDGTWTKAELFDSTINTPQDEYSRFVTRDNRFLFFGRNSDSYWVDISGLLTGLAENPVTKDTPQLFQNVPNPSSGNTSIRYHMRIPGQASLKVYNSLGKEIAVLVNGFVIAGDHQATFNSGDHPAGVYEYVLKTQNSVYIRKMICIK